MASAVFTKLKSVTNNMRYAVQWSTAGKGLPRRKQMSAEDMTTLSLGQPRNWPIGTDKRAPFLPGDVPNSQRDA